MVSNYNEIDRIFYRDGYRLAENHLSAGYTPESLSQLTFAAYDSIDKLNKAFTDRVKKDKMNVDCKKSCYWCCSQAIFVNQHEALFLADYMLNNFNQDELIRVKKLIAAYHYVTSEMTLRTRLLYKKFCPFLSNKICKS